MPKIISIWLVLSDWLCAPSASGQIKALYGVGPRLEHVRRRRF